MTLTVDATYENGALKPAEPLPLRESEKVRITIQTRPMDIMAAYGIMGWKGDAETLRRIAENPEFSVLEAP